MVVSVGHRDVIVESEAKPVRRVELILAASESSKFSPIQNKSTLHARLMHAFVCNIL